MTSNVKNAEKELETLDSKFAPKDTDEKDFENKTLLKQKAGKNVWVPKKSFASVKEENTHHKVRVHFKDHSEIRYVDDNELNVLRKSHRVKKVMHLGRSVGGQVLEYVVEDNQAEKFFVHPDGRKASILSHKYKDESLGTDHYIHLPDTRGTVTDDYSKAEKLLTRLGYKPAKE